MKAVAVAIAGGLLLSACASAPPPHAASSGLALQNAGFEQAASPAACPAGWYCAWHAGARSHAYRLDAASPSSGKQSLCVDPVDPVNNWALLYQVVPAEKLRGARVRLSVSLRTAADPGTGAGPFLLAQGMDGGTVAHDQRLVPETGGWKRLEVEIAVPANAHQLQAGILFESHAPACADDVRLEILPAG